MITTLAVRTIRASATRGRLEAPGLSVACSIGRTGISHRKREGDGASPAGVLRILHGYWRPDRFAVRPRSAIPLRRLRPDDGWADDPRHPAYNRPVRLPFAASHEAMWRADRLYDVVLVLDWNVAPRARQRGSAIFFHLERTDRGPTAGCVAVDHAAMRMILARLSPRARIRIG